MKTATYRGSDGKDFNIEYDENAACIICGEPVAEASMGGTVVCPWCDCGNCRYCRMTVCGYPEDIKTHVQMCKREVK